MQHTAAAPRKLLVLLTSSFRGGAKRTKILSIIASEFGIQRIAEESADTQVYVCAIDPILNDDKFIVPGLGDAGDRIFNTYPTE